MTLVKNVEYDEVDLEYTLNDTIDDTYTVAYDMTGMQLDVYFYREDDIQTKHLSSAGGTPEITILTRTMTWLATGFSDRETTWYKCVLTNGTVVKTIMMGRVMIIKKKK